MIRRLFCVFMFVSFMGSFSVSAQPEPPSVGTEVQNFTLPDVLDGKSKSLEELKGEDGTAIIFVATGCPYSNAFNHVMQQFNERYESKGISVIGINSNKTEPTANVAQHAKSNGFTFPVLKDEGHVIADRFGATVTPEVFFLDEDLVLRYHGALGNSRQPTTKASEANANEIVQAVEALLSDDEIPIKTTKMFGCTIKR